MDEGGYKKGPVGENQAEAERRPREDTDRLDEYIGHTLRARRKAHGLNLEEVARSAGISSALLSRIENGQTSPSLDSLSRISRTLGLTLSEIFQEYETPEGGALHVKSGQGLEVVRQGTRKGHSYHLLSYERGPRQRFEAFLITMDDASEVFPRFKHPGTEFLYMIEGEIEYCHGQFLYRLEPGDALTFDGEIMHGPETLIRVPIRFLSIIDYSKSHESTS